MVFPLGVHMCRMQTLVAACELYSKDLGEAQQFKSYQISAQSRPHIRRKTLKH